MAYSGKYESPGELLRDDSLNHEDKVEMLEQWRDDEKDLMQASDEGMHGDERPDILKGVKKALISVHESALRRRHQSVQP